MPTSFILFYTVKNPYKTRTIKVSKRFYDMDVVCKVLLEGPLAPATSASCSGIKKGIAPVEQARPLRMKERTASALPDGQKGYLASKTKTGNPS